MKSIILNRVLVLILTISFSSLFFSCQKSIPKSEEISNEDVRQELLLLPEEVLPPGAKTMLAQVEDQSLPIAEQIIESNNGNLQVSTVGQKLSTWTVVFERKRNGTLNFVSFSNFKSVPYSVNVSAFNNESAALVVSWDLLGVSNGELGSTSASLILSNPGITLISQNNLFEVTHINDESYDDETVFEVDSEIVTVSGTCANNSSAISAGLLSSDAGLTLDMNSDYAGSETWSFQAQLDLTLEYNTFVILALDVATGSFQPETLLVQVHYNNNNRDSEEFINGPLSVSTPGLKDTIQDVQVQADGKVLTLNYTQHNASNFRDIGFSIFRSNADGTLDTSFNNNGMNPGVFRSSEMFEENDFFGMVEKLALHSDGSILITGMRKDIRNRYHFSLIKLTSNGSPDETFTSGEYPGLVQLPSFLDSFTDEERNLRIYHDIAMDVVIQNDGKIIVAGYTHLNANRPTYDSRIFAPNTTVIARFNTDGSLDHTYGDSGKVFLEETRMTDFGYSIIVQRETFLSLRSDGGIIVATEYKKHRTIDSQNAWRIAVISLNSDGSRNLTFGDDSGVVFVSGNLTADTESIGHSTVKVWDMQVLEDDKILLVASSSSFIVGTDVGNGLVIRLTANGSLDPTFGNSAISGMFAYQSDDSRSTFYKSAITLNGDIVLAIAGWHQKGLVLLEEDGGNLYTKQAIGFLSDVNSNELSSSVHALAVDEVTGTIYAGAQTLYTDQGSFDSVLINNID